LHSTRQVKNQPAKEIEQGRLAVQVPHAGEELVLEQADGQDLLAASRERGEIEADTGQPESNARSDERQNEDGYREATARNDRAVRLPARRCWPGRGFDHLFRHGCFEPPTRRRHVHHDDSSAPRRNGNDEFAMRGSDPLGIAARQRSIRPDGWSGRRARRRHRAVVVYRHRLSTGDLRHRRLFRQQPPGERVRTQAHDRADGEARHCHAEGQAATLTRAGGWTRRWVRYWLAIRAGAASPSCPTSGRMAGWSHWPPGSEM
jgi:hypothetical protein